MPSYHNPNQDMANRLNALAAATFDESTAARDNADKYVRDTVLFASVLFLVAAPDDSRPSRRESRSG